MKQDSKPQPELNSANMAEKVSKSAARRIAARQESDRGIWFGMGLFGIIGWSVAVPTLIGIALGIWIDNKWPGDYSWTLMLMFLGLALGCMNAWRWLRQEGPHKS